ncbi:DgyrCDS14851 [Dimorphilus gyrociliatus]|uniref:DgyrCDS14851 n=1 Tax=Dimorphilus gyrociliatus TaxID=2664684 RepID=A0A7I8WF36_9ANNE|nr:DgyrCDS14851 [Dimorphilus gyrociliatus]
MRQIHILSFLLLLLACGINCQIALRLHVQAVAIEGKSIVIVIEKVTGAPTCSISTAKPDGTVIHTGTVTLTLANTQHQIPSTAIGSITNSFFAKSTFTCQLNSEELVFSHQTYVYSQEDFGQNELPGLFLLFIDMSSQQSSPTTIGVSVDRANTDTTCRTESTDTSKVTIDVSGPFTLDSQIVQIIATKTGSSDFAFVKATCEVASKSFINYIPIYFASGSTDLWVSATGDPHFEQVVNDISTLEKKHICYDVTGTTGDYIYIAGFSMKGIKIFGQLKDDYYMHKIVVQTPFGNMSFSIDSFTLDNKKTFAWNHSLQNLLLATDQFKYHIKNSKMIVITERRSSFSIKIQKSTHGLGEFHLDVSFKTVPEDYPQMTGLLGDVGKKHFTFYSMIQSNRDESEFKSVAVIVNNNLIRGRLQNRKDQISCWLMDINDILKPFKISNYLLQKI